MTTASQEVMFIWFFVLFWPVAFIGLGICMEIDRREADRRINNKVIDLSNCDDRG